MDKELVVVLGMHRSGTSMLTRGLKTLGIELGQALMVAVAGNNEKGFWEDTEVVAFNDRVLAAVSHSWHSLAPLTQVDFQLLADHGYVERAAQILAPKLSQTHTFGLKDPRLCQLLPFWKQVFDRCGATARFIVATRNPLSVARSLEARDGFESIKSHYLWLKHSLGALQDKDVQRAAIVVDYDRLLDAPAPGIIRIADHFGFPIDSSALAEYASTFLETGLRHSHHGQEHLENDPSCPRLVKDVYRLMSKLADGSTPFDSPEAQRAISDFSAQYHEHALLLEHFKGFEISMQTASKTIGVPIANASEYALHVSRLDARLHSAEEHLSALEQSNAFVERDLRVARSNLEVCKAELTALHESTSWRVTAPIRYAKRKVKNAVVVGRAIPVAANRHGGSGRLLARSLRLLFEEGFWGVKRRVRATAISVASEGHQAPPSVVLPDPVPYELRSFDAEYLVDQEQVTQTPSIAIHLYVGSTHALTDIACYLANLPFQYSVLVSVRAGIDHNVVRTALRSALPQVDSIVVEPGSAPGGPLVSLVVNFAASIRAFAYVVHLAADVSLTSKQEPQVRQSVELLLGPKHSDGREVMQITQWLQSGMPSVETAPVSGRDAMRDDAIAIRWLRRTLGDPQLDPDRLTRSAVPMFWARTSGLNPFLDCANDAQAFATLLSLESRTIEQTLHLLMNACGQRAAGRPIYVHENDAY